MPADTETLEAQSAAKGTYSPSDDLMSALNAIPGRDDPNPESPMAQTEPEAKAPTPDPEPAPKTEPAPEPAKPDPVKEPSAEDDPLGLSKFKKKAEEPKKAEPAKQEPAKKPEAQQTPKELRTAYEKLKGELDAERQAKAALQTKLDEALKRPVPEELEKKWKGDLDAASKRASELEESLKLTNFEKSPTYTKEFIEPLTNAWEQAHEELVDQEVTVNGETRKTTPEDLRAVVASPTLIQASRKARELFGDDAGAAMSARDAILKLEKAKDEAMATWRAKGTAYEQEQQQQHQAMRQSAVATFNGRLDSFKRMYPELQPKADDADETKAFEAGHNMNRMAFLEEGLPKFTSPKEQLEFGAKLKGDIAARSAMLGPLAIRLAKAEAALAAANEKLKQLDKSDPALGGGKRSSAEKKGDVVNSIDAAFDAIPTTDGRS